MTYFVRFHARLTDNVPLKLEKLSTEERHKLIAEFSERAIASKSALDEMAQALTHSDNERHRAVQVGTIQTCIFRIIPFYRMCCG